MASFNTDWLDLIRKIPGWITGFLLPLVTAIVGFVKLWQGDTTLVTIVMLVVGIGGGMFACAYVAFKRTPPLIEGGKGVLQYRQWRRSALTGLIMIPLLAVGGVGYYFYEQATPPTKVVVLVADFDGPESQNYRVTEAILEQLRDATKKYPDVEVKAWAQRITAQQGSNFARKTGKQHKAGIVLWGWYGKTQKKVIITAHFEVLRPPENLSLTQEKETMQMAVVDLESFVIQEHLSSKMSYLTLLTVGLARYETQDYDGAIERLSDALRYETPTQMINPSVIYFFTTGHFSNPF